MHLLPMLANAHLQYNNVDPIYHDDQHGYESLISTAYHMDAGRALIVGRRNPQHPPFLGRECQTRKTRFSRPKSRCSTSIFRPLPLGRWARSISPNIGFRVPFLPLPARSLFSRARNVRQRETIREGEEQSSGRARFFASASIHFTSLILAHSSSFIVCNPISSSIQPLCKQASSAIPHPSITYSHPYNPTKHVIFSVLVALFPLSTHSHSPSSPLFTSSALSLASSVCIHLPVFV
jgi:hypothetical protein